MARIRTIKPGFFRSRSLAKVPPSARLTFQGLWCEADDAGVGVADARVLKGSLWPLDDELTHDDIENHLQMLAATGHINLYETDSERYYHVVRWAEHQAPAFRRGKSVYPQPPTSTNTPLHFSAPPEVQESAGVRMGLDGIGDSYSSSTPTVPDIEHVDDEEPWWDQWANLDLARQRRDGRAIHNPAGWLKRAAANRRSEFAERAAALDDLTHNQILVILRRSAGEIPNQPAPLERCPTCDRLTIDCTCPAPDLEETPA